MKTRILGMVCVIASLLQIIDGLRWAVLKITTTDSTSLILDILLSIGSLCGLWGLLSLKGVGTNRIFQGLVFLPIIGFLINMVNDFQQLANVAGPDNPISILGGLLTLLGLLIVGILTIAAKRWTGWRRYTLLIVSLAFPLAILVRSIVHMTGLISIFMGVAMALFGFAVMSSPTEEPNLSSVVRPGLS